MRRVLNAIRKYPAHFAAIGANVGLVSYSGLYLSREMFNLSAFCALISGYVLLVVVTIPDRRD